MYSHSVFGDCLKHFPHPVFRRAVKEYDGDRYSKGFSCHSHLVAMLFGHFSEARSLREIETGWQAHPHVHYHLRTDAARRSTLSDANRRRDWRIFLEPAKALMAQLGRKARSELRDVVRIIDSSPISLHKACFDWAEQTRTPRCRGLKLHAEYAPDAACVTQMDITAANVNDLTQAKAWEQEPGITYVLDKAYCDYNWWWQMQQNGAFFVTRLKKDAAIATLSEDAPVGDSILQDSRIQLTNRTPRGGKRNEYSEPLRKVVVARPDHATALVLVTNRFDLSAEAIAALYKQRWEIELLFKWLKQNLKLKTFLGNGENAIKIQIVTAIIAYLLIRIMKAATGNQNLSLKTYFITFKATLTRTHTPRKIPINQHQLTLPHILQNFPGQ